jgi:hypothetical protein
MGARHSRHRRDQIGSQRSRSSFCASWLCPAGSDQVGGDVRVQHVEGQNLRSGAGTGSSISGSFLCDISDFPKLFLTPDPNHPPIVSRPGPLRGAYHDRLERWAWDAVDAAASARFWRGRTVPTRTAKSCGPDAPMAGVKFSRSSRFLGMTVTNKPGLAGESTE